MYIDSTATTPGDTNFQFHEKKKKLFFSRKIKIIILIKLLLPPVKQIAHTISLMTHKNIIILHTSTGEEFFLLFHDIK